MLSKTWQDATRHESHFLQLRWERDKSETVCVFRSRVIDEDPSFPARRYRLLAWLTGSLASYVVIKELVWNSCILHADSVLSDDQEYVSLPQVNGAVYPGLRLDFA